jgi:hypothetical protein
MAPGASSLVAQPSLRWSSAGIVFLLHVIALVLLLQTDRLRPRPKEAPAMQITMIPLPRATLPPSEIPILPRPATPAPITLPPPRFTVPLEGERPSGAITLPPPRGLDLSIRRETQPSFEQLFPSPEERKKKMMQELSRELDIANAKDPPIGDSDCVAVAAKPGDPTPPAGSFGVGSIPVTACKPHMTLKALKKRNDLYSPH